MLKVNPINSIDCQSIKRPVFKGSNNQYLDVELGYLSDPEYVDKYISTIVDAQKTDLAGSNPVSAFLNKIVKTFHILYTPEISSESAKIKRSIDALVEAEDAAECEDDE